MIAIEATFDGSVFRPNEPVELPPNTPVRLTIERIVDKVEQTASFLRTARSLQLDGPADWSTNLEKYLYGDNDHGA